MAITYFHRIPFFIPWLFPKATWKGHEQAIYLTFDDGPSAEHTLPIAQFLHQQNAPSTFFFLGEKAKQFPHIVEQVKALGHTVGFHANDHVNLRTLSSTWFQANTSPPEVLQDSYLFRAPYGKMTREQLHLLDKKFKVIQWSLMPGDFDASLSYQKKLAQLHRAKNHDIVVLHDLPVTFQLLKDYFKSSPTHVFKSL